MLKCLKSSLVLLQAISCRAKYTASGPHASGVSHVRVVQMRSVLNPSTGQNELTETIRDLVEDLRTGRTIYNEDTHLVPQPGKAASSPHGEAPGTAQPITLELPNAAKRRVARDDSGESTPLEAESFVDIYEADPRGAAIFWKAHDHSKHNVSGNSALGVISLASAAATLAALVLL